MLDVLAYQLSTGILPNLCTNERYAILDYVRQAKEVLIYALLWGRCTTRWHTKMVRSLYRRIRRPLASARYNGSHIKLMRNVRCEPPCRHPNLDRKCGDKLKWFTKGPDWLDIFNGRKCIPSSWTWSLPQIYVFIVWPLHLTFQVFRHSCILEHIEAII